MRNLLLIIICLVLAASLAYADTYSFETGPWKKMDDSGYELITTLNAGLLEEDGRLNEPVAIKKYTIPDDRQIKSVKLIGKSKPVSITANLPQVQYDENYEIIEFKERECLLGNERPAYIAEMPYYFGDESYLEVRYYPLEIKDCKNGEFLLYEEMEIGVEYYEPNKIKEVTHTEFEIGKPATIHIEYENTEPGDYIIFSDEEDPFFEDIEEYIILDFDDIEVTPSTSDVRYTVYYYNEFDEIVDRATVYKGLDWGSVDFRVLFSEEKTLFPLVIQVNNNLEKDIEVDLTINSLDSELQAKSSKTEKVTVNPGINLIKTNFRITEGEIVNDIQIIAAYNNIKEYVIHNSVVRFSEEEIKTGLPPPPGEKIIREMVDTLKEGAGETAADKPKKTLNPVLANALGIIIAVMLTAAVLYIIIKYMRVKPDE